MAMKTTIYINGTVSCFWAEVLKQLLISKRATRQGPNVFT